jgi:hypothetical protein
VAKLRAGGGLSTRGACSKDQSMPADSDLTGTNVNPLWRLAWRHCVFVAELLEGQGLLAFAG